MNKSGVERAEFDGEIVTLSDDEIVYTLADRFYVQQQNVTLKSEPAKIGEKSTDVLISPGDTLVIRKIDQLSMRQPARSIGEMVVDVFHRGHDHPYAVCKTTPEELREFPRELRKNRNMDTPDEISEERVNQLTGRRYTRLREGDTAQQMRQLVITAMKMKIQRELSKI